MVLPWRDPRHSLPAKIREAAVDRLPAPPQGWTIESVARRGPTGLPAPSSPTGTFRDGVINLPPALADELARPLPDLVINPVRAVQRQLATRADIAERYPSLRVTGELDGVTKAALAEFQYRAGIAVTGVIDRATELALGAVDGIPGLPKLPIPAPKPRELGGATKAIVTALGMLLTVLALISGLGFIPADAREIFAIVIAAITPVVVYFVPNFKLPGSRT